MKLPGKDGCCMRQHEPALLYLNKAAEDEVLLDEVLASPRVSDTVILIARKRVNWCIG